MKPVSLAITLLAIGLAISVALNAIQYYNYQQLSAMEQARIDTLANLNQNLTDLQLKYDNLLNLTMILIEMEPYNNNVTPPISQWQAVLIALNYGGWNASSLEGKMVIAHLYYMAFWNDPLANCGETNCLPSYWVIEEVTTPRSNYSAVQNGTTTYMYIWKVDVYSLSGGMPGWEYYVDAASGAMIVLPYSYIQIPIASFNPP